MEPCRIVLVLKVLLLGVTALGNDTLFELTLDLDPVRDQLALYKRRTMVKQKLMTTSSGSPVGRSDIITLNKRLLRNSYFMDSLTHITRERIPERLVHSKGTGGFGYFEVLHDISQYCKADFLNGIGKKTPIAMRLSPSVIERGGSDTFRGARGFAVKFYTKEGNFDFAGFSTSMFVVKDPIYFTTFVRAQRRNPATAIRDKNMLWDFLTIHPEGFSIFLTTLGDMGIPRGYRHTPGFSIHTYQIQNKDGQIYFARLRFTPEIGTASLTTEEASKLDSSDPDSFTRDLYVAIACGKQVSWIFGLQIMTPEQAFNSTIDVFDLTLELPDDEFPVTPVGRLVLDRNPVNQFAEIEQLAFNPCNLVPGVDGGVDKLFEARCLAYRDAHLYRLGANFNRIKVNCPFKANTYNRDGHAPVNDNEKDAPNYYENTFNGPMAYDDYKRVNLVEIFEKKPDNLSQAAQIYKRMSEGEKRRLISNTVDSLGLAIQSLQIKAIDIFTQIDPDLGRRVEEALQSYKEQPVCSGMFS